MQSMHNYIVPEDNSTKYEHTHSSSPTFSSLVWNEQNFEKKREKKKKLTLVSVTTRKRADQGTVVPVSKINADL